MAASCLFKYPQKNLFKLCPIRSVIIRIPTPNLTVIPWSKKSIAATLWADSISMKVSMWSHSDLNRPCEPSWVNRCSLIHSVLHSGDSKCSFRLRAHQGFCVPFDYPLTLEMLRATGRQWITCWWFPSMLRLEAFFLAKECFQCVFTVCFLFLIWATQDKRSFHNMEECLSQALLKCRESKCQSVAGLPAARNVSLLSLGF